MREMPFDKAKKIHPLAWLWEPLENDPGFLLRPMFGGRSAYIDGKAALYFAAGEEPWNGVCVCTEREHHASLQKEFPALVPHSVLGKWLYISQTDDHFEKIAERLVSLARRRDPRIGVVSKPKKRK